MDQYIYFVLHRRLEYPGGAILPLSPPESQAARDLMEQKFARTGVFLYFPSWNSKTQQCRIFHLRTENIIMNQSPELKRDYETATISDLELQDSTWCWKVERRWLPWSKKLPWKSARLSRHAKGGGTSSRSVHLHVPLLSVLLAVAPKNTTIAGIAAGHRRLFR